MNLSFTGREPVPFLFPTNAETACVADGYNRYRRDGVKQTTSRRILPNFLEFLEGKYDSIQVGDVCVTRLEKGVHRTLPLGWRDFLDTPITEEGLKAAVSKELVTNLREEMASAWIFLKLTGRTSSMSCRPYSTRCTWMVGSWNNINTASYCAYINPTFPPHQLTTNYLLG